MMKSGAHKTFRERFMEDNDTIAAISTPIGSGGIGIIRLSGPRAVAIAARFVATKKTPLASRPSHTTALAKAVDPKSGKLVDEVLVTVMKAPNSYTREDVVEINCHSGLPTLRRILSMTLDAGARPAEPGEFTRRAFLSGRIDLTQAQAVISLVRARSDAAARAAAQQAEGCLGKLIGGLSDRLLALAAELEAAVDFVDEDIEPMDSNDIRGRLDSLHDELGLLAAQVTQGKILDTGLSAAIIGRPNVGKSSLLNALAREERAIVSATPGTTRDIVEAQVLVGDIPLLIRDTAGWRQPEGEVETEGIKRTKQALAQADLVIIVLDRSAPLSSGDRELAALLAGVNTIITVMNKSDLPCGLEVKALPEMLGEGSVIELSAKTGAGVEGLGKAVAESVGFMSEEDGGEPILTAAPQERALIDAQTKLGEAICAHEQGFGEEVVAPLIKGAIVSLGVVSGREADEAVLDELFSKFCVGK